jgi:hypothetical protein
MAIKIVNAYDNKKVKVERGFGLSSSRPRQRWRGWIQAPIGSSPPCPASWPPHPLLRSFERGVPYPRVRRRSPSQQNFLVTAHRQHRPTTLSPLSCCRSLPRRTATEVLLSLSRYYMTLPTPLPALKYSLRAAHEPSLAKFTSQRLILNILQPTLPSQPRC